FIVLLFHSSHSYCAIHKFTHDYIVTLYIYIYIHIYIQTTSPLRLSSNYFRRRYDDKARW
ncbi:MAG: hypothetical protein N7Q72_06505, partial [Spiroplasma sp. Tabriz.8]|nr:hypothetical protein [Spiroplasma sp. Tabriz.8]